MANYSTDITVQGCVVKSTEPQPREPFSLSKGATRKYDVCLLSVSGVGPFGRPMQKERKKKEAQDPTSFESSVSPCDT